MNANGRIPIQAPSRALTVKPSQVAPPAKGKAHAPTESPEPSAPAARREPAPPDAHTTPEARGYGAG